MCGYEVEDFKTWGLIENVAGGMLHSRVIRATFLLKSLSHIKTTIRYLIPLIEDNPPSTTTGKAKKKIVLRLAN